MSTWLNKEGSIKKEGVVIVQEGYEWNTKNEKRDKMNQRMRQHIAFLYLLRRYKNAISASNCSV